MAGAGLAISFFAPVLLRFVSGLRVAGSKRRASVPLEKKSSSHCSTSATVRSWDRADSEAVVLPLRMSMTAVALRRAFQRLTSSDSLLIAMERRVGVRRVIRRTGSDRARLRRAWAEPILAGRSCENLADRFPYLPAKSLRVSRTSWMRGLFMGGRDQAVAKGWMEEISCAFSSLAFRSSHSSCKASQYSGRFPK